jgi:signal transduction histidine kinase
MKAAKKSQKDETAKLGRDYAKAFTEYLLKGNEDALHRAYEIGRLALAGGRGILDMADIHHANVARLVRQMKSPAVFERDLDRARQFFGESLYPYEMAHRGFSDATAALRRLNETLEQEIQRIAHGVHDEAGQLLFAARLAMDGVAHELDPSLRGRLQEAGLILDQVEKQLRRLSHELRPTILDDLGLLPALEFLAGRISMSVDLSIQIHSTLKGRCAPTIETAVYRVVQEALTNVTKHARARQVEIQLRKAAKNLHCVVHDDGIGFNAPAVLSSTTRNGLGLIVIRERLNAVGGTLEINSLAGRGTDLLIKIPWRSQ